MAQNKSLPERLSTADFDRLFRKVCNWGRWGADDVRGTLNYITPEQVRNAAALVRSGRTVSLSLPVNTHARPDDLRPAIHYMVSLYDVHSELGEPQFATDFMGSECHGESKTHLDALCHTAYKGRLYNDQPAGSVTSSGAMIQDITAYANGIVGRGILLDIPRLRGAKWLEPGEAVVVDELEAAEKAEGVRAREGDILLFHTGHDRRRRELGSWNPGYDGEGKAGLHPTAVVWLHERRIAAFLPDGDGETVPSKVEGIAYPIHALQIASMGLACADNLDLEDLANLCEHEGRWEFMLTASPLRLPGGTGSLFNPIAIF